MASELVEALTTCPVNTHRVKTLVAQAATLPDADLGALIAEVTAIEPPEDPIHAAYIAATGGMLGGLLGLGPSRWAVVAALAQVGRC